MLYKLFFGVRILTLLLAQVYEVSVTHLVSRTLSTPIDSHHLNFNGRHVDSMQPIMVFWKLLWRPRNQHPTWYLEPEPPCKPRIPMKRKRALTIPILMGRTKKQQTNDQLGSLFFILPAEVRIMIYEYFFGQEKINVILSCGKRRSYPYKNRACPRPWIRGWEILAFLRSCRRVSVLSIPQSHIFCALSFSVGIF